VIGNVSGRGSTGVATLPGLARRLVIAWWRQLAAVAAACGIVAATIAGAIGVGERLRGGLASLAVSRLGGIEAAVVAEGFFGPPLVDRLATAVGEAGSVVPAILLEVTVDRTGEPGRPRASAPARLLACDDPAALGFAGDPGPRDDGVLLNRVVAESLAAVAGDTVVVRMPQPSMVPADSPLGRRTLRSRAARVRVDAVLPDEGLGRFAIRPGQVTGPLVVSTRDLAEKLLGEVGPLEGHIANLALAVPRQPGPSGRLAERLRAGLEPTLADYGLRLEPVGDGSVVRLTSDRLVIPPEADRAAEALLTPFGGRPSLVFLANAMRPLPAEPAASIPYSTVAGIPEGSWPSGGLVDDAGEPLPPPGPGEIIIDRWMADDLAEQGRPVGPGDWLRLEWFLPETLHGRVSESAERLRVSGIAAMRGLAVARDLVPEVKGVTDEASIADWDPPFPFDASRVRSTPPFDQDDRYWKTYAATPKAFVGIATARRLAASRFGQTTAWHLPRGSIDDLESLRADLAAAIRPQAMGLAVVPVREAALAASSGSTPFGGLFIALSMFLVAAGLLLLWLLMSLLVTTHVDEIGTLAAVGFGPRRLSALLTLVAAVAAAGGVLLGVAVGPTWSAVLLGLLGEAWDRSVAGGSAVAFGGNLQPGWSLVAGGLAALVITLLAAATACRRFASRPPGRLFAPTPDRFGPGGHRGGGRGVGRESPRGVCGGGIHACRDARDHRGTGLRAGEPGRRRARVGRGSPAVARRACGPWAQTPAKTSLPGGGDRGGGELSRARRLVVLARRAGRPRRRLRAHRWLGLARQLRSPDRSRSPGSGRGRGGRARREAAAAARAVHDCPPANQRWQLRGLHESLRHRRAASARPTIAMDRPRWVFIHRPPAAAGGRDESVAAARGGPHAVDRRRTAVRTDSRRARRGDRNLGAASGRCRVLLQNR